MKTQEPPPEGWKEVEVSDKLWQIGHLFTWSNVYNGWLRNMVMFTIRKGETYGEAYWREYGETLRDEECVFEPVDVPHE